ncbi:hypothetical protein NEDG_00082 [Nematocida displodere]|uniref:RING-type domain-containing protein n=1 Tax=Nematocida displodere TaxID=1805483 RepID=A0A177EI41_9MICR|nr:hypothetical protein NEDG_00082 [Nematocida displodere]
MKERKTTYSHPTKKVKRERSEESAEEEEVTLETQTNVPEPSERPVPNTFTIISTAISSFVRLVGSTAERMTGGQFRDLSRRQEGDPGHTPNFLSPENTENVPNTENTEHTENVPNTENPENVPNTSPTREEIRRQISRIFTDLFINAVASLNLEEEGQTRAPQPSQEDFEFLFQNHPVLRGQDPSNYIFTVVYYISTDEAPRTKAIDIESLNAAIPEETSLVDRGACSICLDEIKKASAIRILMCKHFFHSKCVSEWLTQYANECPMCRKAAVAVAEDAPEQI